MGQEFIIYPSKCRTDAQALGTDASNLASYARRLDSVKNTIRGYSSSYNNVAAYLDQVLTNVNAEQTALKAMQQTLTSCADTYSKAETKLAGTKVNGTKYSEAKSEDGFRWEDIVLGYEGITGNNPYLLLSTLVKQGLLGDHVVADLAEIMSGTYLVSKNINGIEYLKVAQNGMTNAEIGDWIHNRYGGNWDDYLARNMKDYKLGIYNDATDSYMRTSRYFNDVTDVRLKEYIGNLKNPMTVKSIATDFGKNMIADFDYRDWGKLDGFGKAGKVLGTAGTVLTIGTDVFDNFYDSDTGSWSFSANQVADCTADVGIDLAVGAGAATAGAAVGSLIVPPVGTVVGAGVGMAIGVATNWDFYDFDGDGKKDSAVDGLKMGAHAAIDGIGDWFNDTFSF